MKPSAELFELALDCSRNLDQQIFCVHIGRDGPLVPCCMSIMHLNALPNGLEVDYLQGEITMILTLE